MESLVSNLAARRIVPGWKRVSNPEGSFLRSSRIVRPGDLRSHASHTAPCTPPHQAGSVLAHKGGSVSESEKRHHESHKFSLQGKTEHMKAFEANPKRYSLLHLAYHVFNMRSCSLRPGLSSPGCPGRIPECSGQVRQSGQLRSD